MWVRAVSCKQEDLSSYPLHLHKSQVRPHPGSPSVGGLRQLDPGNSLVSEPRHNRELQVQCESSSQKRKAGSSRGGRAQAASSSMHTLSVDDFYRLVGQPRPHSKIKASPGYRRPYPRKGGGGVGRREGEEVGFGGMVPHLHTFLTLNLLLDVHHGPSCKRRSAAALP